jgi:uncharacterized damage-inducible protein DinB
MNSLRKVVFPIMIVLFVANVSFAGEKMPIFCEEMIGQLDFVEGRLLQLADAVPQGKYNWRPAEGIRSIGEAYLHAAFGNYAFIKFAGHEVPKSANFEMNPQKWDTATTDKKEIAKIVKTSFADAKKMVRNISEKELNEVIQAFGMEMTKRNFMVTMIGHLHEHLGQSIAYARSNDVVPPWSAKGEH